MGSVRTCIVCGEPARSKEHIFPAALGGRRTNKGIYCEQHNNNYSGLASVISAQLAFFNAQIGVIGDHAVDVTPVTMTDVVSGREFEFSNAKARFKTPRVISEDIVGDVTKREMSFNDDDQANRWIDHKRRQGFHVETTSRTSERNFYVGTGRIQVTLGGNDDGLRAVGYIAQTFLAHYFPTVARLPLMRGMIDYTSQNIGSGYVWWDFEDAGNCPASTFKFGHRIVVGLDEDTGDVYARISLFSTLDFAVLFGQTSIMESQEIVVDIDPLANSPPNDIVSSLSMNATATVKKPENLSASLVAAIESGQALQRINSLMRKIQDHQTITIAAELFKKIGDAGALLNADRVDLFYSIIVSKSQAVFRLMSYSVETFARQAVTPIDMALVERGKKAIQLDANSSNGITAEATQSLIDACKALTNQMCVDFDEGKLTQDHLAMLIGGGAGAYVVAKSIFQPFVEDPLS